MSYKNPTDILRKEHDKVLKILDSLENNLESGDRNQAKKSMILLEKEYNKHSLNKEEQDYIYRLKNLYKETAVLLE